MNKTITFNELAKEINTELDNSLNLIIYVRDIDLQKVKVKYLKGYIQVVREYKYQAQKHNDEQSANVFFAFHNLLNSVKSCIQTIINLKENVHDKAWSSFIDAQEYLDASALVKNKLHGLDDYFNHLKNMEKCYFPTWKVYNSPGLIESVGNCNICHKEYGKCNHIEGILYSGTVCISINKKILRYDHCAMVEKPKDKRCIISKISTDDGYMQDYMTLKKLDKVKSNDDNKNALHAECILMNMKPIDIN